MLYKKFTRLTFPKNVPTLKTRTLVRSGLLSEADSCPKRTLVRIDIIGFQTRDRFGKESVLQPLVRIDLFEA